MPVRQWFENLAAREKALVLAAGVLAVIAFFVIAVVRPLAQDQRRLGQQVADKQAVLEDIERVAARFGPAPGNNTGQGNTSTESLVVLVDRTTRTRGLGAYLRRNEPDGAASIRLRFENVPFDDLVAWLAEMQVAHGIGVANFNAESTATAGRVSANMQLSRATNG
jgi:general secretion pathway protein M